MSTDGDRPKKEQWATLRNAAIIVTSGLAMVGIVVVAGMYAQHVHAERQELKAAICQVAYETELLSLQLQAQNQYTRYINAKVNSFKAERGWPEKPKVEKPGDAHFHGGIMKQTLGAAGALKGEGDELRTRYNDGIVCPERGGKLWQEF